MAASHLQIEGAHKRVVKGNVDWYYGGGEEAYPNIAAAFAQVPVPIRIGKTVGVYSGEGKIIEYWWQSNTEDLVLKNSGGEGAGSPQTLQDTLALGNTGNIDIVLTNDASLGFKDTGSSFTLELNGPSTSLTKNEQLDLPKGSGTLVLSVNNIPADANGNVVVPIPVGEGETPVFTSDIQVKLMNGKTLGKYLNGQTVSAIGKTFEQVMKDIAAEDFPATASLSANPGPSDIEVGSTLNIVLNGTYTRNDGPVLTSTSLRRNNIQIALNTPYTDTNVLITKNPVTYQIRYNNSLDSNSITYTGLHRVFLSPISDTPVSSTQVRSYPSVYENQFIQLNTGFTDVKFAVILPPGKTLVSVIDIDALNLNITSEYIQSTINVADAGGTVTSRNMYIKTQSVPYTTNHRHNITIS